MDRLWIDFQREIFLDTPEELLTCISMTNCNIEM